MRWYRHHGCLLALLLLGCSSVRLMPVRSSLFLPAEGDGSAAVTPAARFQDTLFLAASPGWSAQQTYASAVQLFQQGEYARAQSLFLSLVTAGQLPDSVAAEALFYSGECAAALGNLAQARTTYERLLQQQTTPPSVRERALLRLGHVLCAAGEPDRAATVFAQLRQQFPASRYLPLANCSAVGSPMPR